MNIKQILLAVALVGLITITGCGGGGGGGGSGSGGGVISITPPGTQLSPPAEINTSYSNTNDYSLNYGLQSINAEKAYERRYMGQGATIAIIDTGFDLTHPDFTNITGRLRPGYDFFNNDNTVTPSALEHGTFVALVAAGGQDADGPSRLHTITLTNGNESISGNFHGVAPMASIIPVQGSSDTIRGAIFNTENTNPYRFAAITMGAQIVNNSYAFRNMLPLYGRRSNGDWWQLRSGSIPFGMSSLIPFAYSDPTIAATLGYVAISNVITTIANISRPADIVYVWAAGNNGWQEGSSVALCIQDGGLDLSALSSSGCNSTLTVSQQSFLNMTVESLGDYAISPVALAPLSIDVNDPGGYAAGPLYDPSLLGKWLVVGAVNANTVIADLSNGCGRWSKLWCVVAPGAALATVTSMINGNITTSVLDGTSFSAPIASGALAVLRSRFEGTPMSIILAILLTTATDLGATGVDDIYGWGLINLEKAITLQGNVQLPINITIPTLPTLGLSPPKPIDRSYRNTQDYNLNYGLQNINANKAYERGYFGQGVTIAIADSGVDLTHPDFAGRLQQGYDFANFDSTVGPSYTSHGTFVALVAAGGRDDNSRQHTITLANGTLAISDNFHGVAPEASIVPLQLNSHTLGFFNGDITAALRFATTMGVQIVNNSYGPGAPALYGRLENGNWWELDSRRYGGAVLPAGLYNLSTISDPNVAKIYDFSPFRVKNIATQAVTADIVYVWAAGNDGWHKGNQVRLCIHSKVHNLSDLATRDCKSSQVMTQQKFLSLTVEGTGIYTPPITNLIPTPTALAKNVELATLNIGFSNPGGASVGPLYAPSLLGKWLAVGAVDSRNQIASFSNGCGPAKMWCMVAPGVGLTGNNSPRGLNGTSFSAPIASGALAVLKSRHTDMPMSVILAILLTTATDLGAPGVDDIYGWGLVNLEKAITLQGNVGFVTRSLKNTNTGNANALRLADLSKTNVDLPPLLSHIGDRLGNIQIALNVPTASKNIYYNSSLSKIMSIKQAPQVSSLGDAAADMLRPLKDNRHTMDNQWGAFYGATNVKDNQFQYVGGELAFDDWGALAFQYNFCDDCKESVWQSFGDMDTMASGLPFFARADKSTMIEWKGLALRPFAAFSMDTRPYQQYGLRWSDNIGGHFNLLAEVSQINESGSFMGADFGALGTTQTKTQQARLALNADIDSQTRLFGGYEMAFINADISGGLLESLSDVRASGWMLGIARDDVFSSRDELRFMVRQQTNLSHGTASIRHLQAGCSDGSKGDCFNNAFYGDITNVGGGRQVLSSSRTLVDLAKGSNMILSLGYMIETSDKSQLGFGVEYEPKGKAAISAQWQLEF